MIGVQMPLFATSGDTSIAYLADYWHEANGRWFRGKLTPVPIVAMSPWSPGPTLGTYGLDKHTGKPRIEIRLSLLRAMHEPEWYWEATGVVLHEMIHQYVHQCVDWRLHYSTTLGGHGDEFTAECNRIGAKLGLVPVVARKPRGRKVPLSRHWPSSAKPASAAVAA